jgi:hypothetical protein
VDSRERVGILIIRKDFKKSLIWREYERELDSTGNIVGCTPEDIE